MFTCPKCGGHTFRSSTLPDGSVERECSGAVFDTLQVQLSKPQPVTTPSKGKKTLRQRRDAVRSEALDALHGAAAAAAFASSPTVTNRHARACTFMWAAIDDALYGISEADLAESSTQA